MWRKHLPVFLLVFLGVLSIGLKITETSDMGGAQEREIELLTLYMNAHNLIPAETFDLNKEGSFVAHVYRYRHCDGGWLISPMYRNSEAVTLFARQATYQNYAVGPVFYLLDGKTYQAFPDWDLWLSQKISAAKHVVGLGDGGAIPVFAVRQFGQCGKGGVL